MQRVSEWEVTKRRGAVFFRVSLTTMDNWINKGCPNEKRGRYVMLYLPDVVEWMRAGNQSGEDALDLQAERARLAKEQADKTAMENGRLRGELAPVGAARKLLESVGSTFKTRILSIPSKLAPAIIGLKTLPEVRELIEEYLHDALHELSRLTEADLGSAAGPAGGTPAAEADNKRVGRPRKKIKS